ncbi:MAG: ABC transporter permease [Clostridiaceae bacterium]|jgi:hypothetical protein|nr:ABC transporter permease [Clostridiaceae bacterium]
MPLKTSYFNKGILKNNIKRFWLIPFSYTFFMLIIIMGYINIEIDLMNRTKNPELLNLLGNTIFETSDVMVLFLGFYPLVAALAMFSYMHFQKNTAMIHSLPLTRSTLYVTNYISGLVIVIIPLLFNGLILIITEVIVGIPKTSYTWAWLGVNLIMTFLLYNFAIFIGMFSGHMAAHAIFFYILNFLALFIEGVIRSIMVNFFFGYSYSYIDPTFEVLSPLYYLETLYRGFQSDRGNIVVLVGYFIVGIVFLVSAYYLYKKRQMEVATDVISYSFVKPIFKYSVAFCSAALIGTIIVDILSVSETLSAYIISYLIGGFIGYFAAEMLMRKTFRVFKAYKGFVAFSLILSLFLCSIEFDLYGFERKVPKDSEVEIISVSSYHDLVMRIALNPEEYNPDAHRYLFITIFEPSEEYSDNFSNQPPKVLDDELIKRLRESMPGISENREVISKVRQIHSYIVENKNIFKENEKLRNMYIDGQQADLFQHRDLYFIYRLKDGSLLERQYSLLTNSNNTELDKLLREYFALPGVRESYEPILVKDIEDIHCINISVYTREGHYQEFEIIENIQDFLDVYKKDILAADPLERMFGGSGKYDYNVRVRIDFKKAHTNRGGSDSRSLYEGFENTMNYLFEQGLLER